VLFDAISIVSVGVLIMNGSLEVFVSLTGLYITRSSLPLNMSSVLIEFSRSGSGFVPVKFSLLTCVLRLVSREEKENREIGKTRRKIELKRKFIVFITASFLRYKGKVKG
jgi:hypothetical protein